MEHPVIEFRNIYKTFGDEPVLRGVNLSITKGEITAIIGKSGCGKSVLLKHAAGLLLEDSGEILYEGVPAHRMNRSQRAAVKSKLSYMFQNCALFDSMTVWENIALPLTEKKKQTRNEISLRVKDLLEKLDLGEIEDKYPSEVSGGMKKRVALARALITEPEIVLFDEPTTGLDPLRKKAVHEMITEYQKKFGFTGVVVSHEIPDVFHISQNIAMLNDGKIIFEGAPDKIEKSCDANVEQFIEAVMPRV